MYLNTDHIQVKMVLPYGKKVAKGLTDSLVLGLGTKHGSTHECSHFATEGWCMNLFSHA